MSTLETRSVSVERGRRTILDDATISVSTGEFLVLIGPNGSGKSTLLRTLAGLWQPTHGSVLLDGQPLGHRRRNEIARLIAFVPQETHVDFAFTVAEILAMGRYPHRGRFAPESKTDRDAIQCAAESCDIVHLLDRSLGSLSGGERQRVLIARSLAVEPEFILLDEPTANLDIQHSLEVLELSSTFTQRKQAVIFASHDLNLIATHATRLALLHRGKIVSIGPPEQVLHPTALAEVFNVKAEVIRTHEGSSVFVFQPRSPSQSDHSSRRT
jgi:cobalamin transport system ATP-binding protein